MLVIQCMLLMFKLFSKKSGSILIHTVDTLLHFSFWRTFSLSAAAVSFLVVLFHCLENASTNHAVVFRYFAYFNSSFSLSDSVLCLIQLCLIHWAQLDRKPIFLNVLVNFFVSLNLWKYICI